MRAHLLGPPILFALYLAGAWIGWRMSTLRETEVSAPIRGFGRRMSKPMRVFAGAFGAASIAFGLGVLAEHLDSRLLAYISVAIATPSIGVGHGALMSTWKWLRRRVAQSSERYWDRVEQKCDADENCRKMRAAVQEIGREFEARPYEELLQPAEVLSVSRIFDGDLLHFSAEAFCVDDNGDIHFCIDAGGLPTKTFWQPSYQFIKRRDGSVARD